MWSIGIYAGDTPFALGPAPGVTNPVLTGRDVSDIRGRYVADPFMVSVAGGWLMFFEVWNEDTGLGEIGLARSADGLRWKYEQIVLREPFHLSYPGVFSWQDRWYMLPETHQANGIRLYRADEFPGRWTLASTLIDGEFVDPSSFFHQDRWWMFAGGGGPPFRADTLRLFMADDLFGPWTEHPRSPVVTGNGHIARPGGRVLVADGRVYRFTQDCDPEYGRALRAFEITELTPGIYRETPVSATPLLQPSGSGWNATGMHHVDLHRQGDGRWRACVDGWFWETIT